MGDEHVKGRPSLSDYLDEAEHAAAASRLDRYAEGLLVLAGVGWLGLQILQDCSSAFPQLQQGLRLLNWAASNMFG